MAAETVVEEAVVVNATFISTRGTFASHGTVKTRGTAHMVVVETTGDGDTANLQTIPTLPQPKLRAFRTEGTHPKTVIRTTNRAGTEDHLSRRMTHGLHINNHPTEAVEEGTTQDMMARTAAERMGTLEGEVALLPTEEVLRMAVGDIVIEEAREEEEDIDMAVTVVDIISPRRTAVTVEAVITEAVVIILVEVTNPVEAINPVDRTALVSSLTGTGIEEDTTKEVEAVEEGIDLGAYAYMGVPLRFVSSVLSSCFEPNLVPFADILTVMSIYYVSKYYM